MKRKENEGGFDTRISRRILLHEVLLVLLIQSFG